MAEKKAPGVGVAAVLDGNAVWSAGFGMADLEASVPVSGATLFRLGSVSKPITAVAALQLWERGKLDLDAPVQKYCPSFPEKQAAITTRQLLGHLGGIRHYRADSLDDPEIGNTKHFDNPIEGGLQFFRNDPLVSAPGSRFHYSTQGFTLIGCVIEGASGQKYVDFVRQNVFTPASMTSTLADDRYAIIANRTRFYHLDRSGAVVNADFLDSSYKIPGGGWISSADDMARFESALLHDTLLRRETRTLMWTAQKPAEGPASNYGMGWGISPRGVGHGGGQQGTSTYILISPNRRAGVVVLVNRDDADIASLAGEMLAIVSKATPSSASALALQAPSSASALALQAPSSR
jgi:serine beta-lactamase-like protein LACTB, mitochondrial